MSGFLTEEQRALLIAQHRGDRDRRVCDRIKAVLLYDEGWCLEKIAHALLLSDEAIRKHIKDYQTAQKLKPANGGSTSKLTAAQQQDLVAHLESHNYVYTKDICSYVERFYVVSYSIVGMQKLLHRLGFTYKKPKLVPGKLDRQKQEDWQYQYHLMKSSIKENEAIYFMDSVHPQYQARARCGWIRKNTNKTLPSFSGWKRKHIIGAIELSSLNVVSSEKDKVNGDKIIEFLRVLEASEPEKEKIYLICDNAGYHKSKKVKEHLRNSKIELIYLPPYSPNLNPIERLWKYMHRIVSNNKWYEDFKNFSDAIDRFFAEIPRHKEKLRSLINDNFQSIHIDHFANSSC
jgi:transposase